MKWLLILAVAIATCSGAIDTDSSSGTVTDSASGSGDGAASGGVTAETGGSPSTAKVSATATQTFTESPDATGVASASASVVVNTPETTPFIGTGTGILPTGIEPTTEAPTPAPTPKPTPAPTPKPTPAPTPGPTNKPPAPCDICNSPDFMGFGFKAGKCGCCPWPCCCKCIEGPGEDGGPCQALIDLAFIMDDSGSISASDWIVAKQFFNDVVQIFPQIGVDQHVSSVTFSTNSTLNWNLGDPETSNKEALEEAIAGLIRTAGFTNTAEAIERATNEVFVAGQDNPAAANVAVVMTDGRANFRRNEIPSLAANLREKAETICIGVTNEVDMDELRMICDESRIFSVNDFQSLQTILLELQSTICPLPTVTEKCFCCCSPEQFWGNGGARYYSR